MCGIVGSISLNKNKNSISKRIEEATTAIAHRGPDDSGYFSDGGVYFGFRRLSIIDLSHFGHQPMSNKNRSLQIIFNGEIYNFMELREGLRSKGHKFVSKTDTEVILAGYQEYGKEIVKKLKGMFAFAIYDKKSGEVFLARDRFGIKPLYYYSDENNFVFASEIKSIIKLTNKKVAVDLEALNEYFTFQNIFSDKTLFKGIKLLPPASTIVIDLESKRILIQKFWEVNYQENSSLTKRKSMDTVKHLLEQSVERHMIADVPVGSYLSGGMDSASLVAIASKKVPHLRTFTGGFDLSSVSGMELVFDERKDAELASSTFKTEHYEMVMHSGDMARVMQELIWHLEDLRVGMCYQNYYISGLASKFVKVVLSGVGGDELFAGYPWRYDIVKNARNHEEFNKEYYKYWTRLIPDSEKRKFFTNNVWTKTKDHHPYEELRKITAAVETERPLNKALYFEFKTFLHGLLVVEDKVSMAHSLEVRVPFLDYDLVDFVATIPPQLKVKNGIGKYILRETLAEFLPKEIVEKKKQGFSPPDESWYRGEGLAYIKDILLEPKTLNRGFYEPKYVRRVLDEHTGGKINHRLLIWSLLSFEWWCRNFLD